MTTYSTHTTIQTSDPLTFNWAGRLLLRWKNHREMKRTWRVLNTLPDYALRDIGIHRSEIGGIANYKRLKNRF